MSREKKVEKSVDFYKGILSIFVVSLFGMIAYLYMYIDSLSMLKIIVLIAGILVMAISALIIGWVCIKYLDELEKF
mgnify:FL=1